MMKDHLTRESEQLLLEDYGRSPAPMLEDKLLRSQLGLVWKLARQHRARGIDLEDLAQEGALGLLRAIRRFDPSRGTRLSTYAGWWIRAYQWRFLLQNHRLVRIGTTQTQRRIFFRLGRLRAQLEASGLEATVERIAKLIGVDVGAVREMDARLRGREQSLDAPTHADGRSRVDELVAGGPLADEQLAAREMDVIVGSERDLFRKTLDKRRRILFDSRWVTLNPPTLSAMGILFGISRERTRQLEKKMLVQLGTRLSQRLSA
jgi:RNA polymerase sigma-32 factor